ncbi:NAD(P)H-dependent glycerol-3-phosphate dehydrogenase [Streptomyces sp. NPDC057910]|uniref:NAD(P)H-dependent glycerol-3-phosphate dehydrogenase n=1 Tax=Streptomyces sp. NPDC057910 TaxID=3346278 RepID=UPI0036F02435
MKVAVLSAGSWGTAFAAVLANAAGNDVVLHARRTEIADAINSLHENPAYLPGIPLPATLRATTDPAKALAGADFMVVSIPAQTLRANLAQWSPLIEPQTVVVSLMKGIETHSGLRMSEVITEVTRLSKERVAVVSGPNLAREIAEKQPAASVIASTNNTVATALQQACMSPYFRPYTNSDVIGCELGGAVKNVIALAVGLAGGMGLGHNATALLMTRGLAETARLGTLLGATPLTFSGLAGVGDLITTCSSPLSRNRTFGEHLGQGMTVDEATIATKQTAEGVKSSPALLALAHRYAVEMPITEVVVDVIKGRTDVRQAAERLMARAPRPER